MSRFLGVVCCAVIAVGGLMLSASESENVSKEHSAETDSEMSACVSPGAAKRIQEILNAPLKSPLEFVEMPLNEILEILEDEYDIPIVIDLAALEEIVVSPDFEVTIDIRCVSLRTALKLLFRQPGVEDLTFIVDQEVLLMTSKDRASSTTIPVVYRVDDLIKVDVAGYSYSEEDYDSLINVITSVIELDSWAENGTGDGEIQPLPPGMLVISQTRRVHEMIANLLRDLKEMRGSIDDGHQSQNDSARLISKGFQVHDENLVASLKDEEFRILVTDSLRESVNWQPADGIDEDDIWIRVLPELVLVRHHPSVVKQVRTAMLNMNLLKAGGGGLGCGAMGGSADRSEPTPAETESAGRGGGRF